MTNRLANIFQTAILICVVLAVIGVPLVFHPDLIDRHPIPKATVFKILALVALNLWAFRIITEKKFIFRKSGLDLPIILYLISCFLSFKNALNISAFENSIINTIFFLSFYYLVLNNIKKEWVEIVLSFSAIAAIGISSIGIYQHITAISFNLNTTVTSTLGHSNFLAQYLIAVLPLCLSLFIKSSKTEEAVFWGGGFLIVFSCLILTFVRGGWLGFLVSSVVFFLLYNLNIKEKKKKAFSVKEKRIAIVFIIVLVIGGILLSSKSYIFKTIFISSEKSIETINPDAGKNTEFEYKILTALLRLEMWKSAVEMIKKYPVFGVGLGNYSVQSPKFRTTNELKVNKYLPFWAHNDYLQIASETGILGISAFLFLLATFFYKAIKSLRLMEKNLMIVAIGLISSLPATLTHSFFSFNLYQIVPTMLLWLCMGLVMASRDGEEFRFEFSYPEIIKKYGEVPLKIIAGIAVFVLFSIGYIDSLKPLMADIYYSRAERSSMREQWEESVPLLEKANELEPANPKYRYAFALSFYKTGKFRESIENGKIAHRLNPYVADVNRILCFSHNEIGNEYAKDGETDSAIKEYDEVIRLIDERKKLKLRPYEVSFLEREMANVYYNRGNIFYRKKQYRKAFYDYQNTLRIIPLHPYAVKAVEKIKSLSETNPEVASNIAPLMKGVNYSLYIAHNAVWREIFSKEIMDSSLKELDIVIELLMERKTFKLTPAEITATDRELADAYYNRGNVFLKKKSYNEAMSDYQEALKIIPNHPEATEGCKKIKERQKASLSWLIVISAQHYTG